MCQKASCDTCKGRSWWGCGKHVSTVLDATPASTRCSCEPRIERHCRAYPPMAQKPGWLIQNAAALVLWTRGKKAGWSPEGVVEEPLQQGGS